MNLVNELGNRLDIREIRNFEEYWLVSVGPMFYDKYVKNYSKKMWQIDSNTLISDFKFDGNGVKLRTG